MAFSSARSILTPESDLPPSTAVMKNTSTVSRWNILPPRIRMLKSGTSWSACATARPTTWVGVTRCPAVRAVAMNARMFVASISIAP